jgi:hypothetical protein
MSPAVNKPVVKEVKEADINRKLQLFGIYSAFENGKVPSVCPSCCPSNNYVVREII